MKAELKYYNKEVLKEGHILEIRIWEISDYSEGLKYSLILIDPKSKDRVLMDNHKPKNHHYHLNEKEFNYAFQGIDKLFEDFKKLALIHLKVKL